MSNLLHKANDKLTLNNNVKVIEDNNNNRNQNSIQNKIKNNNNDDLNISNSTATTNFAPTNNANIQ